MKSFVIFRRELMGYFLSPVAWVVAVVAALMMARFFENFAMFRRTATLDGVYFSVANWLFLIMPALTMGSLASEFRNGTIEVLATDPVSDYQIVLGKFMGVLAFFAFCLVPLPVFYGLLRFVGGSPDIGPVISGLGSLLLAGSLCAAIGIFASALSAQQVVAYLIAALLLFALRQVGETEPLDIPDWLRSVFGYLSLPNHLVGLMRGKIALNDVIYFVSTTALFLFLATRILEARRWA